MAFNANGKGSRPVTVSRGRVDAPDSLGCDADEQEEESDGTGSEHWTARKIQAHSAVDHHKNPGNNKLSGAAQRRLRSGNPTMGNGTYGLHANFAPNGTKGP